jgi:hypothetical protein
MRISLTYLYTIFRYGYPVPTKNSIEHQDKNPLIELLEGWSSDPLLAKLLSPFLADRHSSRLTEKLGF